MIVDERFITYVNSLNPGNSPLLEEIEQEAHAELVPIIRRETQQLLKTLLVMTQPGAILEIGTAIGFSSIYMMEQNPVECRITTIENYNKRIPIARRNFERAGIESKVELLEGDAAEILPTLEETFDFIFMDAAKAQYINLLPYVKKLLRPGGTLITDNVLQDGEIIESKFAVCRRDRTIHKRIREYLYAITHDKELVTTVLTVGDGIALSVKKGIEHEKTRIISTSKQS